MFWDLGLLEGFGVSGFVGFRVSGFLLFRLYKLQDPARGLIPVRRTAIL